MAPSFLLRKSDSKADIKLCDESDFAPPKSIRLDWRMQGRKRNRSLLELQSPQSFSALDTPIAESSLIVTDVPVADVPPSHTVISPTNSRRFLTALNALIRTSRPTEAVTDNDTVRPPAGRPRATSVPSKPADFCDVEPVEVPAELPVWLIAPAAWEKSLNQGELPDTLSKDWCQQSDPIDTSRFSFVSNVESELVLRRILSRHGSQVRPTSIHALAVDDVSPEPPSPAQSENWDMAGFQSAVPFAFHTTPELHNNASVEPLQSHSDMSQPHTSSAGKPSWGEAMPQTSSDCRLLEGHHLGSPTDQELLALKAAHYAHMTCIHEEHQREIASLKTHISLLEKRATLPAGQHLSPSGLLPLLDTRSRSHSRQPSESRSRSPSCDSMMRPSDASVRSLESALEWQRRKLDEAVMENQDLLNLGKQREATIAEQATKIAILEQAVQVRDRNNKHMKAVMLGVATSEITFKTTINELKAKLAASSETMEDLSNKLATANEARLDLAESCDAVKGRVKVLLDQQTALREEREALERDHKSHLTATKDRASFLEKRLQEQHAAHNAQLQASQERHSAAITEAEDRCAVVEKRLEQLQTKLRVEKDHAKSARASVKRLEDQLKARDDPSGMITIVNALESTQVSPLKTPDMSPARGKDFAAKLKQRIALLEAGRDKLLDILALEESRPKNHDSPRSVTSSCSSRRDSILGKYEYKLPWSGDAHELTYNAFFDEVKKVYEEEASQMRFDIKMYEQGKECYKKDIRSLKHAFRNADKDAFEVFRSNSRLSTISPGDRPESIRVRSLQVTPSTASERPAVLRGRRSVSVDSSSPAAVLGMKNPRPVLRHHLSLDTTRGSELQAKAIAARRKESGSSKNSWSGTSTKSESTVYGSPAEGDEGLRPLSMVVEAGSAIETH